MKLRRSKRGGKKTPAELDYLFTRSIIDEEDYVDFWSRYWKANASGREQLIDEYTTMSLELSGETPKSSFPVTRSKSEAMKQAQSASELTNVKFKVVRRNKRGQFSRRGHFYQAVRK